MVLLKALDPVEDYKVIRKELENYSGKLARKPEIVIANKMDLPDAEENLKRFKKEFPDKEIIAISAADRSGIDNMVIRHDWERMDLFYLAC